MLDDRISYGWRDRQHAIRFLRSAARALSPDVSWNITRYVHDWTPLSALPFLELLVALRNSPNSLDLVRKHYVNYRWADAGGYEYPTGADEYLAFETILDAGEIDAAYRFVSG